MPQNTKLAKDDFMVLISMTPPPYTVSYMSTIMMIYIGKIDPKKYKDEHSYWGEFKIWFK